MTKSQVDYAERKALQRLDEWVDVTGVICMHSGYHSELEGLIIDAVHIDIQMAIHGKVIIVDGEVVHGDELYKLQKGN